MVSPIAMSTASLGDQAALGPGSPELQCLPFPCSRFLFVLFSTKTLLVLSASQCLNIFFNPVFIIVILELYVLTSPLCHYRKVTPCSPFLFLWCVCVRCRSFKGTWRGTLGQTARLPMPQLPHLSGRTSLLSPLHRPIVWGSGLGKVEVVQTK